MQNDAGECIYSVTFLTRKNMFRSRVGQSRLDPLAIGNDHTRFPFRPGSLRRLQSGCQYQLRETKHVSSCHTTEN